MCVVNKQFELLECIFDSIYVDLQYDEISLTFTAGSVAALLGKSRKTPNNVYFLVILRVQCVRSFLQHFIAQMCNHHMSMNTLFI